MKDNEIVKWLLIILNIFYYRNDGPQPFCCQYLFIHLCIGKTLFDFKNPNTYIFFHFLTETYQV